MQRTSSPIIAAGLMDDTSSLYSCLMPLQTGQPTESRASSRSDRTRSPPHSGRSRPRSTGRVSHQVSLLLLARELLSQLIRIVVHQLAERTRLQLLSAVHKIQRAVVGISEVETLRFVSRLLVSLIATTYGSRLANLRLKNTLLQVNAFQNQFAPAVAVPRRTPLSPVLSPLVIPQSRLSSSFIRFHVTLSWIHLPQLLRSRFWLLPRPSHPVRSVTERDHLHDARPTVYVEARTLSEDTLRPQNLKAAGTIFRRCVELIQTRDEPEVSS